MDEKTKELIAIGASVASHCQPCLIFHINKARQLGIETAEIREAITMGKGVQNGAMSAMNKFARGLLDALTDSPVELSQEGENKMITVKVFDPAMCCSTGVCGPTVDSALVEFAGALKAIAEKGITVERSNLAQQPQAFSQNPQVKKQLTELGNKCLPLIYINDELKITGRYPSAQELFALLGIEQKGSPSTGAGAKVAQESIVGPKKDDDSGNTGSCCSGKSSCC